MTNYNVSFVAVGDASTTAPSGFSGSAGGWHFYGYTITFEPDPTVQTLGVTDSDQWFDDDEASQTLTSDTVIDGVLYPAGTNVENEYVVQLQDSSGNVYDVIGVSAGDTDDIIGFVFPGTMPPTGEALTPVGNFDGANDTYAYSNMVACLAAGTMIDTPGGPLPIEKLRTGDLVTTLDDGPQPLRHLLRRDVVFDQSNANHKPILISAGALGHDLPQRHLRLSPQHRVMNARSACLVASKALTALPRVRQMQGLRKVSYFNPAFDRHQIILAEGLAVESFFSRRTGA
ncbi:hypothetical protein DDZ14_16370 [Maritimibacter sp. 55A14]|uniref:Hint domain-containing protein n=1 Tax=Maritimibacter sp. 55A14 TaxID=2174844 RepID=UPI000D61F7D8|nr:Hint domain-containing protein [Maritimibacter sp. 55A14]PWE29908.1 hypothetical protein DDZ14_16370 [Maritimibacter sp. 55A14]